MHLAPKTAIYQISFITLSSLHLKINSKGHFYVWWLIKLTTAILIIKCLLSLTNFLFVSSFQLKLPAILFCKSFGLTSVT